MGHDAGRHAVGDTRREAGGAALVNTRTGWPSTMPRALASAVLIQTSSRSARMRIG